jgi:hypothetical protein
MNEIQIRINFIIQLLAGDLSKSDKVIETSQAFSGMDITHFTEEKQQSVYKYIITTNKIMAKYPTIKSYDDYKIITDIDLNKLLKSVQQLCLKLLNE